MRSLAEICVDPDSVLIHFPEYVSLRGASGSPALPFSLVTKTNYSPRDSSDNLEQLLNMPVISVTEVVSHAERSSEETDTQLVNM